MRHSNAEFFRLPLSDYVTLMRHRQDVRTGAETHTAVTVLRSGAELIEGRLQGIAPSATLRYVRRRFPGFLDPSAK